MDDQSYEHGYDVNHPRVDHLRTFVAGLLIGSLAGTGVMLLLAPQSGKKSRAKIQQKGMQLHDQTGETVEDAVAQSRLKARRFRTGVHKQADVLQQRGQDMLDGQKERLSTVVEDGKKAVQDARG